MELKTQFSHITRLIADAKQRAYQAVNHELVALYWNIGEYLHTQVSTKAWGKSVVQDLAAFIAKTEPNMKGFSAQNLWRMNRSGEPPVLRNVQRYAKTRHTVARNPLVAQ